MKHLISEVDKKIGAQLKNIRIREGLTQKQLSKVMGVTFQQIQKYEKGQNRITASKLYVVSKSLNLPIIDFFSDLKN